jgi:hypothetical protein
MPGTRKMTEAELLGTMKYLMKAASIDLSNTFLACTNDKNEFTNKEVLIKKLRSIARNCSRAANRLEELGN